MSVITERRDRDNVGFWDGHYVIGVMSRFQHAREECESKRAYVFQVSDG